MKATEQYFPVVLFIIMLHKEVLTSESLDYGISCQHETFDRSSFEFIFYFSFLQKIESDEDEDDLFGEKKKPPESDEEQEESEEEEEEPKKVN